MKDRFRFRAWFPRHGTMLYNVQQMYDGMGVYLDSYGKRIDVYPLDIEVKELYGNKECVAHYGVTSAFCSFLEESDLVLMQCTGLKDSTGRLIYEGDILQHSNGVTSPVEWDEYDASFMVNSAKLMGWSLCSSNQLTVTGNIYEGVIYGTPEGIQK